MRAVDAILALVLTVTAVPLEGQEPAPPARRTELGLMGFSARGGVDFDSAGQAVVSVAVDLGYLLTPRMRLRPSGELGFLGGDNTYVANVEIVYRFRPDADVAVPYVGGGLGLFGRAACGSDPGCPHVWLQFSLGFELRVRPGVRWLIEYHPENAFRRQRVFVGLATDLGI
jgi:hypothetical protein